MSEDNAYQDADIVWVKLGSSWWPGEVCGHNRQPEGFLQQAKRKPYCVVKFFQEDSFEYVKSSKHILPFNCNKKDEFIRKGHELFKAKKKFMEKFPSDVSTAERLTRSVTRSTLFFNSRPDSIVKAIIGDSPAQSEYIQNGKRCDNVTKIINITPNRNSEPSHASSSPPTYKCSICDFKSNRQNVMVLHRKSHSGQPVTPAKAPLANNSDATSLSEENTISKHLAKSTVFAENPVLQTKEDKCRESESIELRKLHEITPSEDRSPEIRLVEETSEQRITKNSTMQSCNLLPGEKQSTNNSFKISSTSPTDSFNKAKSENIQKSLLADWIDEEKDDEEECENSLDVTTLKVLPICEFETIRSEIPPTSAASSNSPSQSNQIEPSESIVKSFIPTSPKLSSKIRNIPKKDRRNIIFTNESIDSVETAKNNVQNIDHLRIGLISKSIDSKSEELEEKSDHVSTSEATIQKTAEESNPKDVSLQLSYVTSSAADEAALPGSTFTELLDSNQTGTEKTNQSLSENRTHPEPAIDQIERSSVVQQSYSETSAVIDTVGELSDSSVPIEDNAKNTQHSTSEPSSANESVPIPTKQLAENQFDIIDSNIEIENQAISSQDQQEIMTSKESIEVPPAIQANKVSLEDKDSSICESAIANGTFANDLSEKGFHTSLTSTEIQITETKVDPTTVNIETEATVPTNASNVNKPSLSCFDFQEEEDTDILTSIAKFKKKYISPEKNNEPSKDSEVDLKKIDLETKDRQLTEDIESLLKSTSLQVEIAKTSFVAEKSITNEVRGLPIKERGKRIFKSRNRFRAESCSSLPTSTTEKNKAEDSLLKIKDERAETSSHEELNSESLLKTYTELTGNGKPFRDKETGFCVNENISQQVADTKEKVSPLSNKQEPDSNVPSSEEEIVGRISFTPAEVFAPESENIDKEPPADVSSTNSDLHIAPPSVDDSCNKEQISNSSFMKANECQPPIDTSEEADTSTKDQSLQSLKSSEMSNHSLPSPDTDGITNIHNEIQSYTKHIPHDEPTNAYYVVEETEPIYEVEVYDGEVNMKNNDSNFEISNEYDLITTEVTSIVDRIITSDVIEADASEPDRSKSPNNKTVAVATTDSSAGADSCAEKESNSQSFALESVKTDKPDVTIHSEEISSSLAVESQSESICRLEDENTELDIEREDTSGDESSTVISEAEAEFGSPTSMLEEDRLLNLERSESQTPISNIECTDSLKRNLSTKESCEEGVNDQGFKGDNDHTSQLDVHENDTSIEDQSTIQKGTIMGNDNVESAYFDASLTCKGESERDMEKESSGEVLEMNSIEEDDEISSPPIEPLQDEIKDHDEQNQIVTATQIQDEEQGNNNVPREIKDLIETQGEDLETVREMPTISPELTNSSHNSSQKSNKIKDELEHTEGKEDFSETNIDSEKSNFAGEELSAAEALLLIPNQPSNILESSYDQPSVVSDQVTLSPDNNASSTVEINHSVKEERTKNNESGGWETIRKKRRSHMKITPRKRITETKESEKNDNEYQKGAKIAKVEDQDVKTPDTLKPVTKEATQNKSFAEQYEENFVPKYMKNQPVWGSDKGEPSKTTMEKSLHPVGKQTPEKVHITVDVSNPLSSQIANILGPNRPAVTDTNTRGGAKKRKQTLEDDIPSFIIKRPSPKNSAEAEAADRDTIAQIQNLCPHVEITRKTSRDDQTLSGVQSVKPQIINQQIIRTGNNHNQPIITVTAKSKRTEDGIFDISNMPIVLSNESVLNDNLHLVITPTSNPEIIRKIQNQQLVLGSTNNTEPPVSNSSSGVQVCGSSNLKMNRTTSRQHIQDQQAQEQLSSQEGTQETDVIEEHNQEHRQNLQQQYFHQHKQLQQQTQQQEQKHVHQFYQRQPQAQPHQHFQQQFQIHHQTQVQQQLQDEQRILLQQQQEVVLQQQLQMQPQQPDQQVTSSEKVTQTDKQIGVDTRGNKYVIIKAPPNTVLQRVQHQQQPDTNNASSPRKLPHSVSKASTTQQVEFSAQSSSSSLSPSLSHISLIPIQSQATQQETNPIQCTAIHTSEQPNTPSNSSSLPTAVTKSKTSGRGRRCKQSNKSEEVLSTANDSPNKNTTKGNTSSKRSSAANVFESSTRQRSTRSSTANKRRSPMISSSETQQSTSRDSSGISSSSSYTTTQQETHSILYMSNPNSPSPVVCTNTMSPQVQPQQFDQNFTRNPLEAPEGSSGGFAVPSLPVPGYPQTYLLCELIDKKYREVSTKPLYLSEDRTKLLEVPDEFLTDSHRRLTDSQREPNPDVLQVISGSTSNMLQPRVVDTKSLVDHQLQPDHTQINFGNNKKPNEFSVSEQTSTLMCLQEQIVQEHLVQDEAIQKQFSQDHLTPGQLVQEQFVSEQFVQEQFVQEQFVQEQFVQEQYVQEQLGHEQLVQEQLGQDHFVQEQLVHGQFIQGNILHHQQSGLGTDGQNLDSDSAVEESIETSGQTVILNVGEQQIILDGNAFVNIVNSNNIDVMSDGESNTFTIPAHAIQQLLNSFNNLQNITTDGQFENEVCDQQIEMDESMLQNTNTDDNVLTVALDDPSLYSDEQFIDSGQILQIETAEGLRLIGTATGNAGIVLRSMMTPMQAKTSETSVLLNQGPKMSAIEMPSDKSKAKFDTEPATTATLEDCLNVIGVPAQSSSVPASLELPASVTNPAITVKVRPPTPGSIAMNEIIATGLCHHPDISSLPPIVTGTQELHYEFFPSNTDTHDKTNANEESAVPDIGEYVVASSCGSFDEPGR